MAQEDVPRAGPVLWAAFSSWQARLEALGRHGSGRGSAPSQEESDEVPRKLTLTEPFASVVNVRHWCRARKEDLLYQCNWCGTYLEWESRPEAWRTHWKECSGDLRPNKPGKRRRNQDQ